MTMRAFRTILFAGLVAGALDIVAAILQNLQLGPRVVLQAVASGLLGPTAYQSGWPTASLGLALHFVMMLVIAAIYVLGAGFQPALRRRWLISGTLWGIIVWLVMTCVVVPLSASGLPAPDVAAIIKGLATHILAVGLPIAFIAHRITRSDTAG